MSAKKKRQHYVPKFYLRRFTEGGEADQIRVFNISRQMLIDGASLADQCYKNYFYDRDGTIEDWFAGIEGRTADILRNPASIDPRRFETWFPIILFVCLQRARTLAGKKRFDEMTDAISAIVRRDGATEKLLKEIDETYLEGMNIILKATVQTMFAMMDLKVVALRADRNAQFLTSDAPVCHVNPLWRKLGGTGGFGLGSSGLLIFLPTSPRECLVFYDGGTYLCPRPRGESVVARPNDVAIVNAVVAANCHANLYVSDAWSLAEVKNLWEHAVRIRPATFTQTTELFPSSEPGKYVRAESPDVMPGAKSSIILTSNNNPKLPEKPRFLVYRTNPRYFHDGSAAGPQRDPAWLAIVADFQAAMDREGVHISELPLFALGHPAFEHVGMWKQVFTQEASGR